MGTATKHKAVRRAASRTVTKEMAQAVSAAIETLKLHAIRLDALDPKFDEIHDELSRREAARNTVRQLKSRLDRLDVDKAAAGPLLTRIESIETGIDQLDRRTEHVPERFLALEAQLVERERGRMHQVAKLETDRMHRVEELGVKVEQLEADLFERIEEIARLRVSDRLAADETADRLDVRIAHVESVASGRDDALYKRFEALGKHVGHLRERLDGFEQKTVKTFAHMERERPVGFWDRIWHLVTGQCGMKPIWVDPKTGEEHY